MSKTKMLVNRTKKYIHRNDYILGTDRKAEKNKVNLQWWTVNHSGALNCGDYLANPVYDYMLNYYGLDKNKVLQKTIFLNTIGSLLGECYQDAVVWGSGFRIGGIPFQLKLKMVKYDVRAVRGPKSKALLEKCGINCPEVFGDPGILMPLIYQPHINYREYEYSVIHHWSKQSETKLNGCNYINMLTDDYENVIDQIVKSKLIISGSLHGIILAETYGIPAILLQDREDFSSLQFKYDDYYLSTGRSSYPKAKTIAEALEMNPSPVPNLESLQENLIRSFPKDIWD